MVSLDVTRNISRCGARFRFIPFSLSYDLEYFRPKKYQVYEALFGQNRTSTLSNFFPGIYFRISAIFFFNICISKNIGAIMFYFQTKR